ncbi:MAG: DUF3179 domain-containing protein, partial [Acidobacteria bacterium]|nr:DUF3179 domain-containing protein [Acidobacteriota bacterium]
RVDDVTLRFGVSGLLRKSDLVMWDDATDSLWQQITGEGIVGTHAGVQLEVLLSSIVSFEQFTERHPNGLSLDPESGRGDGAYGRNPYVGYSSQSGPNPRFYTDEIDDRFEALERVVGVTVGDADRAYRFVDLVEQHVINDTIGGEPIVVLWGGTTVDALDASSISNSAVIGTAAAYSATLADGKTLTLVSVGDEIRDEETDSIWSVLGEATDGELEGTKLNLVAHRNEFWFAWSGFFPDGQVYVG